MALRKITVDNSVRYIAQSEQIQSVSRDIKPSMIKNISILKNQNQKITRNSKNFIRDIVTGEVFRILKWITSCYF